MGDIKTIGLVGRDYAGIAFQLATVLKELGKEVAINDKAAKPVLNGEGEPLIEVGEDALEVDTVPYVRSGKLELQSDGVMIELLGTDAELDNNDINIIVAAEDPALLRELNQLKAAVVEEPDDKPEVETSSEEETSSEAASEEKSKVSVVTGKVTTLVKKITKSAEKVLKPADKKNNFLVCRNYTGVAKSKIKALAKRFACRDSYYMQPGSRDEMVLLRYTFTGRMHILFMKEAYYHDFLYKIAEEIIPDLSEKDFKKALWRVQKGGNRE